MDIFFLFFFLILCKIILGFSKKIVLLKKMLHLLNYKEMLKGSQLDQKALSKKMSGHLGNSFSIIESFSIPHT